MQVERSIFIPRSPATVFGYAARPENMPAWNPAVVASRVLGTLRVGALVVQQIRLAGRTFETLFEITAFRPPAIIACDATGGPVRMRAAMEFHRVPHGTVVRWVLDGESRGLFRVGDALLLRVGELQMETCLGTLRELVLRIEPVTESPSPRRGTAGAAARSEGPIALPRAQIAVTWPAGASASTSPAGRRPQRTKE